MVIGVKMQGNACEYLHWGDMDYGGINIFEFIKNHIFPDIKPYLMDKESFYKAIQAGYGVKLKPETREKLLGKDAGMLEKLKQCILETNMTIEQEVFLENL
uniref:Wadjet anti-phage system protein JetD domain-containing protein n=1 Tax=Agathobacter sp. TaxID=2021311 RepID=UPI00402696B1